MFFFQIGGFKSVFVQFAFRVRLVEGHYFPWSLSVLEELPHANVQLFWGYWRSMDNISSHLSKFLFDYKSTEDINMQS